MINAADLLAAHVRTEGGTKIPPQPADPADPVEYVGAPATSGALPIGGRPPATQGSAR